MALQGVPPWHTAAEMRTISNFAHWVEGAFIALLAIVALLEVAGRFRAGKQRYLWPLLVLTPGAFLAVILLVPHHGLDLARAQIEFVWNDPQQRQHVFIAFALLAAGIAEFVRRRRPEWNANWVRFVWPAAAAGIGLSFLLHQQSRRGPTSRIIPPATTGEALVLPTRSGTIVPLGTEPGLDYESHARGNTDVCDLLLSSFTTKEKPVAKVKGPVCGLMIEPAEAVATAKRKGKTYYFCSQECKESFEEDPESYAT